MRIVPFTGVIAKLGVPSTDGRVLSLAASIGQLPAPVHSENHRLIGLVTSAHKIPLDDGTQEVHASGHILAGYLNSEDSNDKTHCGIEMQYMDVDDEGESVTRLTGTIGPLMVYHTGDRRPAWPDVYISAHGQTSTPDTSTVIKPGGIGPSLWYSDGSGYAMRLDTPPAASVMSTRQLVLALALARLAVNQLTLAQRDQVESVGAA